MLYRGPSGRSRAAYRVLFIVLPADTAGGEGTIYILRILHGAREESSA
jgi:hypothetical protein